MQLKKVKGELMYKQYKHKKSLYPKKITLYEAKKDINLYFIFFYFTLLINIEELLIVYTHIFIQYHQV